MARTSRVFALVATVACAILLVCAHGTEVTVDAASGGVVTAASVQDEIVPAAVPAASRVQEEAAGSTAEQAEEVASTAEQAEEVASTAEQAEEVASTAEQEEVVTSKPEQEEVVTSKPEQEAAATTTPPQNDPATATLVQQDGPVARTQAPAEPTTAASAPAEPVTAAPKQDRVLGAPRPLTIDVSQPEVGVKRACLEMGLPAVAGAALAASLSSDDVQVTTIGGGITNKLFKCAMTDEAVARAFQAGAQDVSPARTTVLVRWFGQNTEVLIDREREASVMQQLTEQGFGCPMLGAFANGRVEKFLHGFSALDAEHFQDAEISKLIAAQMGAMHRLQLAGSREPAVWRTLRKWMKLVMAVRFDSGDDARLLRALQPVNLAREVAWLRAVAQEQIFKSPLVVCHNDLLPANVMLATNGTEKRVTLIDFEYSDWNARGFDLANHFLEHAGFECDWQALPSQQHRRAFYHEYTRHVAPGLASVSAQALQSHFIALDTEVDFYSLVSHMYWGLWGIVQQKHSTIPFDYLPYAKRRIDRYWEEKEALVSQYPINP